MAFIGLGARDGADVWPMAVNAPRRNRLSGRAWGGKRMMGTIFCQRRRAKSHDMTFSAFVPALRTRGSEAPVFRT
jgi:hypothetical protein